MNILEQLKHSPNGKFIVEVSVCQQSTNKYLYLLVIKDHITDYTKLVLYNLRSY